jgi:hypothetical protein
MPNLEGIYRDGMHVVPLLENGKIRITVEFGQIVVNTDQASKLIGLLEGALEQFGNYTFGIGYDDATR